jgi:hypothetical protein
LLGYCGTTAKEKTQTPASDKQPSAPATDQKTEEPLPPLHPQRIWYAFYSLLFTTVPLAVVVLLLMFCLRSGTAPDLFSPYFGQGQLGQFVVIILIAGNVCTLAIAGILGSSEVSAIYGGIVGYVLGKKSQS